MNYLAQLRDVLKPGGPAAIENSAGNGPSPAVETKRKKVQLPVVQGRAPEFSLHSMIDMFLAQADENEKVFANFKFRGPRSDGVFHASEVSKEQVCRRAMAYGIYGTPKDSKLVDARIRRIFDNGHFTHARIESYVIGAVAMNSGRAWNELSYAPDDKLRSGTADVGLVYNGWPYLVEVKSIKKSGFEALGATADPDHIGQLNQYMGLSGVHAGFILYECKDNQELREYFVRFDKEMWDGVGKVCDEVLTHVYVGTLPDKINEDDGCRGDWCSFYRSCKARSNKEKWLPPGPLTMAQLRERNE